MTSPGRTKLRSSDAGIPVLDLALYMANETGRDRYAIPYFFDPCTDYVIECLATCQDADNPPRYKPVAYGDYLKWFMTRNYRAGPGDPDVPPP